MGGGDEPEATGLTHIGPDGAARMVDVGGKAESERRAVAEAVVRMKPETARAVEAGDGPKGDVLGTARIAGIGAAKQAGVAGAARPSATAQLRRRPRRRRSGRGDGHADRRGPLRGADRGRDRGDGGRVGRGADGLRHGQGDRARASRSSGSGCCTRAAARAASGMRPMAEPPFAFGRPILSDQLLAGRGRAEGRTESGDRVGQVRRGARRRGRRPRADRRRPRPIADRFAT